MKAMDSIKPVDWSSVQPQEYDAAESMLQHSRSARSNSSQGVSRYPMQNYGIQSTQTQLPSIATQIAAFSPFSQHVSAPDGIGTSSSFSTEDGKLSSPHNVQKSLDPPQRGPNSQEDKGNHSIEVQRSSLNSVSRSVDQYRNRSIDDSQPPSPASIRGPDVHQSDRWSRQSSGETHVQGKSKGHLQSKPAWADQKTKAGKERKRLPLACIACRRKKIRCSGEKPACKHCSRSRTPCVYKVTARKPAPRTDYMAMLDRRLKRMEERVIKITPKEGIHDSLVYPRATIKPGSSGRFPGDKKRSAEEAFEAQIDEWAGSQQNTFAAKENRHEGSKACTEGAEHLPSKEIQEYLSEVFFDYVYGQSYHLMHKPSYMRRLRDNTLPPVLILAVCAVAARFAIHSEIASEPAYLRGEDWAAPARDIVLKHFDEPNINILTVTVILGLHEFGTCQGGRSWMFAGMATRMAHALQLHREMDHDPLGKKNGSKSELSFTDREIRRRTMWACFTIDRFTASGTERPMFADEEDIKVQLPVKERSFLQEIPGPTEDLTGEVHNPVTPNTDQASDAKGNMGVAAYMIRFIALWGRVIKYLNMGGREKDQFPMWSPESRFAHLKGQVGELKESLPPELLNTEENLESHASEKLANQFLFMHIASYQIILFLHRFAIPNTPGCGPTQDMPKLFVTEAIPIAIDAANQISSLIAKASDHRAFAPFMGYCAFLSSTVHIWGYLSDNESLKATASKHLAENIDFLNKMKRYWGVLQFMADNLRDVYRQHCDAALKGKREASKEAKVVHYGDWFDRYPYATSQTDSDDTGVRVKEDSDKHLLPSRRPGSQKLEEFFHTPPPPGKLAQPKKPRKSSKPLSQVTRKPSHPAPSLPTIRPPLMQTSPSMAMPDAQLTMMPSPFAVNHDLYYQPDDPYSTTNNFGAISSQSNQALLPQLDRQMVYNAYAGNDPSASSSTSALNAMTGGADPQDFTPVNGNAMWDGSPPIEMSQQTMLLGSEGNPGPYMPDMSTSAWFMPFNLNPPDVNGNFGAPSG